MKMSLFLRPPPRPIPPPAKRPFDPELSLTLQDKREMKLREFHQSLLALTPRTTGTNSTTSTKRRQVSIPDPKMRVFVSYNEDILPIDVAEGKTVAEVKQLVTSAFGIRPSQPARGGSEAVDTILCLNYAGSDLDDNWVLSDIGIHPGASIHAFLREEEQPTIHIYCDYNNDTIRILQKFKPAEIMVSEIRSIASRKCGLPVGIYRLVTKTDKREMFDINTLDKYDVMLGDTVHLEIWDGWNDFINLAARGFTTQALAKLSTDEFVARYQMKVALYIAAYHGHVDLAVVLLKQGIRSDEAVGEHPYRQWCSAVNRHTDSLKCPIHVASEAGQFGIVRTFVHNNVCSVMAKDGNGLRPLNLALRNKKKACASFLLTKQWSRVNFATTSIPLSLYAKMKHWSVRAKEKALMLHGLEKSTLRKKLNPDAPLVGQGIYLDGFSDCLMSSKSSSGILKDKFACSGEPAHRQYLREKDPEYYFRVINNQRPKVIRNQRNSRQAQRAGSRIFDDVISPEEHGLKLPSLTEKSRKPSFGTGHEDSRDDATVQRLPAITRRSHGETILEEGAESPVSVFARETDQPTKQHNARKKKRKEAPSDFLLTKAKTADASIPLPIHSAETIAKPVFHKGALGLSDLASSTLNQYESRYRGGMKARDYAVKCLQIASTFKEKPWLQQVRIALTLTDRNVKKSVRKQQRHPATIDSHHECIDGQSDSDSSSY